MISALGEGPAPSDVYLHGQQKELAVTATAERTYRSGLHPLHGILLAGTVPLGFDFSTPAMGDEFAEGVFIGEHGSWNRADPVGSRWSSCPSATASLTATPSISLLDSSRMTTRLAAGRSA